MSAKEKIEQLEGLLARVQQRASQARPVSGVSPLAITASAQQPAARAAAQAAVRAATAKAAAPQQVSVPPATPPTPRVSEPVPAMPSAPPTASRPSTVPPITTVDAGVEASGDYDDSDVDIEVSTETVDIDVDVDMDDMGMPLESGAQPVADHDSFGDEPQGETTVTDEQIPMLEPMPEEPVAAKALANEIEEPAPSSSPRPIASEKPEAFEDESAPRHTPPPESGKQISAAPSTPPSRKTSAPPPSLEGHTLIGGWREPGLGGPIIGKPGQHPPPGVRVPAPPPGAQHPGPGSPLGSMAPEPVTGTRLAGNVPQAPLTAEVTRAELPAAASVRVAAFEGAAPAFKPSTFGELLDATLAL